MYARNVAVIMMIVSLMGACSGEDRTQEETSPHDRYIPGAPSVPSPVTFAVFGNSGLVTDDGKTLNDLVHAANEYGVDFCVNLGNRLPAGVSPGGTHYLWETVDGFSELFEAPVFPVMGRTDVFDDESDAVYSRRYGPAWYSFMRGGTHFVVINTRDQAWRTGFGLTPRIGSEQLDWLERILNQPAGSHPVVLFMNEPLWVDTPVFWKQQLLPMLKAGNVGVIVTGSPGGLRDWGKIDGIRAVSTGCTGPMESKKLRLFPHFLLVTVNGRGSCAFSVLLPDGTTHRGITLDNGTVEAFEELVKSLEIRTLHADPEWNISETITLSIKNTFDRPVSGSLAFSLSPQTRWRIEPNPLELSLSPGTEKTVILEIRGYSPELGPVPRYRTVLKLGENPAYDREDALRIRIPQPRTGDVVPTRATIPQVVPYAFDGSPLKIPVDIESADTCGRLFIYREDETERPECLYVSNLRDFSPGITTFTWNGTDLEGKPVSPGEITFLLVVYNKKAPVTWVANGPTCADGTLLVERTLTGLRAVTHDETSLVSHRIGAMMGAPRAEVVQSFEEVLGGLTMTGFSRDADDRVFLGTPAGIVCVYVRKNQVIPDRAFGRDGYVRLTDVRGRQIGSPVYFNGVVYVGIGGGEGHSPALLMIDGAFGEKLSTIDLGEYFGTAALPPTVAVNERGIYCAHPDNDDVLMLAHYGDILWVNGPGDNIGDRASDGRSYTYGIAADRFGLSYVNTPGYSARCGVIGPDGRGLFRVILVQLPGLRVSSVFPVIEGRDTDGLYFVTRGGDVSYVFHVPYTIRAGKIVEPEQLSADEE